MNNIIGFPLKFTEAAVKKVKSLIANQKNSSSRDLRFRVYIIGGGCRGFQYGFMFDDKVNEDDVTVEKQGVKLIVDQMSLRYLVGSSVDYHESLAGSRFVVNNPNTKGTCGCGFSFSI